MIHIPNLMMMTLSANTFIISKGEKSAENLQPNILH